MIHIYLNLKRFDVPVELGGVNRLYPVQSWAAAIVEQLEKHVLNFNQSEVDFTVFLPEAHLLSAMNALNPESILKIGTQGIYRNDVKAGHNFGAFTSLFPAASAKAIGCQAALIGHCEERKDKIELLQMAGLSYSEANAIVNKVLNQEIHCALNQGLSVLYAIGEQEEEMDNWEHVLSMQLQEGLKNVDLSKVCIAYEPIWSIGPGKKPADQEYITKAARYIKKLYPSLDVVYGGGLKEDNAEMLADIFEIDGGLIALTRFQGEIGFYPDEYFSIAQKYIDRKK